MESVSASSMIRVYPPLNLNSNTPSSFNRPSYVSSRRYLPSKNKIVTLRRFNTHSRRYFTPKIAGDRCVFPVDKVVIQRPVLDQCTRFSCFHHGRRKRFPICKSTPSAFSDKSVFHLSKHGVD
ncbi:hypothetical protein M8C21_024584, partial [Ambrosia artemisiifolia]